MASRFNRYLCFEDYSPDQLIAIFLADAEKRVEHYIGELYQRRTEEGFRYGRDVRNPLEMIIAQKAEPIIILNGVDDATLVELTLSDAENALRLAASGICSKRPNVLLGKTIAVEQERAKASLEARNNPWILQRCFSRFKSTTA